MKLVENYERGLALLRKSAQDFGEKYPRIASELGIKGGTCADPHVEHMIQSFAYIAARIDCRLDDSYPQFTESLLENLYPHYLRTFPSCSVARLIADQEQKGATMTIARGTIMKTRAIKGVKCQFRTAYALTLAPIALSRVKFHPIIGAPARIVLAPGIGSEICIDIESTAAPSLREIEIERLRVFIDGDLSYAAAARDTLLMRVATAYVEFDSNGKWMQLDEIPIKAVGFTDADALIPFAARSHPAYRLLLELFAFPEKFNFIDIDWARVRKLLPPGCRQSTLHLALKDIRSDSDLAHILSHSSAKNFLLDCTPVVNLFRQSGVPVNISHTAPDYELLADAALPEAYEIHTVEKASLVTDSAVSSSVTELQPFYGLHYGQQNTKDCQFWVTRRDELTEQHSPGHERRIALVDNELAPVSIQSQTLSVELTCSNRDLPSLLSYGSPGELSINGVAGKASATFLRKPSASLRLQADNNAHWRLIAHFSLNLRPLTELGLEEFRKMLRLYDLRQSPTSQRQIDGITDMKYKVVMAWIAGKPSSALMPGVQIRMTLDEEAFIGSGIHLFAQTIDHFFGLYGQINTFTQLIILSMKSGEELLKCSPRSGEIIIV